MIISIDVPCKCGNKNINQFLEYNGLLGYEAIVCKLCARYSDHYGFHEAEEFSKKLVNLKVGY